MGSFVHLETDLICPFCGVAVRDVVWFRWGFSWGWDGGTYSLGEPIRWRTCSDGTIPAWVYFSGSAGNLGDPTVLNLIVKDESPFYWNPEIPTGYDHAKPQSCANCKEPLEGAIVEIRNGIIQQARIYLPGEYAKNIVYFIIEPNNTIKPMPDWNDHPMADLKNC